MIAIALRQTALIAIYYTILFLICVLGINDLVGNHIGTVIFIVHGLAPFQSLWYYSKFTLARGLKKETWDSLLSLTTVGSKLKFNKIVVKQMFFSILFDTECFRYFPLGLLGSCATPKIYRKYMESINRKP